MADNNANLPLGLGMALAQNTDAMKYFCSLSKEKQQELINKTHEIKSRKEMRSFVTDIGNGSYNSFS